jgi:uncharacterized damage-inducible protein DinB
MTLDDLRLDNLRLLLDYNYWARDRLLDAVAPLSAEQLTRDLGNSFKSVHDTLVHLHLAERVWYMRWHGESPTGMPPADAFTDLASIQRAWADHEAKMRAFVEAMTPSDVDRVIEYKLLNGQPAASPLWQMLQHLINHGSYHRGQVTTMLRQLGAAPPKSTDLIVFYRERTAAVRA